MPGKDTTDALFILRRMQEEFRFARWREGVGAIAEGMRCIRPPSDTRKNRIKTG